MISGGWFLCHSGTLPGVTPDTERPFTLDQMGAGRPRRRAGLAIGIAAGAVLLIGATVAVTLIATRGSDAPAAQQPQTPAAATASTTNAAPPATTAAAATTAAQPPAMLKFGTKAERPNGSAVAYAYKQPVAKGAPKPEQEGFEWGAADVEICSKVEGYFNNLSWVLIYADHTRIEASSVGYQQFPLPEYPAGDTDIAPGQCVRGWITYPVPAGQRPVAVHYQPQGYQADWQVS